MMLSHKKKGFWDRLEKKKESEEAMEDMPFPRKGMAAGFLFFI